MPTLPVGTDSQQSGYTLIELLVGMTIFLLAAAIVPAAYNRVVPGAKLEQETQEIVRQIKALRFKALSTSRIHELWFDELDAGYSLDQGGSWLRLPDGLHLSFHGAHKKRVSEYATIEFYPGGGSTGGDLVLTGPRASKTVSVDWLTGEVTVTDER